MAPLSQTGRPEQQGPQPRKKLSSVHRADLYCDRCVVLCTCTLSKTHIHTHTTPQPSLRHASGQIHYQSGPPALVPYAKRPAVPPRRRHTMQHRRCRDGRFKNMSCLCPLCNAAKAYQLLRHRHRHHHRHRRFHRHHHRRRHRHQEQQHYRYHQ